MRSLRSFLASTRRVVHLDGLQIHQPTANPRFRLSPNSSITAALAASFLCVSAPLRETSPVPAARAVSFLSVSASPTSIL